MAAKSSSTRASGPTKRRPSTKALTRSGTPTSSAKKKTSSRESTSSAGANAKSAPESDHFRSAKNRAERILRDPEATRKLADAADKKADAKRGRRMKEVMTELRALIRIIRAYANGSYRAVS